MIKRIAWILAAAGVIPFIVGTVALLASESSVRVPAIAGLVTYAAVILSFLGGIEWGLAIREEASNERIRAMALGFSAVPSMAAWAVLWLPTPRWQVGAALGIFLAVWAADQWMASQGLLPAWFVDLRTAITAIVAVILAVALYLL